MMKNSQLDHAAHTATTKRFSLCLLAHDIDSPVNVGSLFRIADALGIEKIYLTGESVRPPNLKITRTARSTDKHVPYQFDQDVGGVVAMLKQIGYRIVSLEITSNSVDVRNFSVNAGEKVCLLLGAENTGVSQELLDMSDATVHIPMLGINSSMNVAVACSIASYEIIGKLHGLS